MWRSSDFTSNSDTWLNFVGSDSHNSCVDSAGDAVLVLNVQLWKSVLVESGVLTDISCGTGIDDVSHGELSNCLILWYTPVAVGATGHGIVAAAVLVSAVILPLLWHFVFSKSSYSTKLSL